MLLAASIPIATEEEIKVNRHRSKIKEKATELAPSPQKSTPNPKELTDVKTQTEENEQSITENLECRAEHIDKTDDAHLYLPIGLRKGTRNCTKRYPIP